MEKLMGVDMIQTREDLEQYAFDARAIQAFMVPRFHELIEVSVHILHTDMEFLSQWVQEDIESRYEMRVNGQGAQKNDFAKLQAGRTRIKGFLHCLDRNDTASSRNMRTRGADPSQHDAPKASISDIFQHFKFILQTHGGHDAVGLTSCLHVRCNRHFSPRNSILVSERTAERQLPHPNF
jgi:hypothetical protein